MQEVGRRGRKRGRNREEYWDVWDCEQLKRSAAVECLMSASDQVSLSICVLICFFHLAIPTCVQLGFNMYICMSIVHYILHLSSDILKCDCQSS